MCDRNRRRDGDHVLLPLSLYTIFWVFLSLAVVVSLWGPYGSVRQWPSTILFLGLLLMYIYVPVRCLVFSSLGLCTYFSCVSPSFFSSPVSFFPFFLVCAPARRPPHSIASEYEIRQQQHHKKLEKKEEEEEIEGAKSRPVNTNNMSIKRWRCDSSFCLLRRDI